MDADLANYNFLCCTKEFDFDKVEKVMQFLNWEWASIGIPKEEDMLDVCKSLLRDCIKDIHESDWVKTGTGGFFITLYQDSTVNVEFVLENAEWESDW